MVPLIFSFFLRVSLSQSLPRLSIKYGGSVIHASTLLSGNVFKNTRASPHTILFIIPINLHTIDKRNEKSYSPVKNVIADLRNLGIVMTPLRLYLATMKHLRPLGRIIIVNAIVD